MSRLGTVDHNVLILKSIKSSYNPLFIKVILKTLHLNPFHDVKLDVMKE